jgi:hypothetical protein
MIHYTQEEISNAILQYLLRHPQAQDTLEGIVHWWLLEERIHQRTLEISEVVKVLVKKHFLIEKKISNTDVLYSLNTKKKDVIKSMIEKQNVFQNKTSTK